MSGCHTCGGIPSMVQSIDLHKPDRKTLHKLILFIPVNNRRRDRISLFTGASCTSLSSYPEKSMSYHKSEVNGISYRLTHTT